MICEKCWSDAYLRSYGTSKSQYECYLELLKERKDNPCQPVAQSNNACSGLAETSVENDYPNTLGVLRKHGYPDNPANR